MQLIADKGKKRPELLLPGSADAFGSALAFATAFGGALAFAAAFGGCCCMVLLLLPGAADAFGGGDIAIALVAGVETAAVGAAEGSAEGATRASSSESLDGSCKSCSTANIVAKFSATDGGGGEADEGV